MKNNLSFQIIVVIIALPLLIMFLGACESTRTETMTTGIPSQIAETPIPMTSPVLDIPMSSPSPAPKDDRKVNPLPDDESGATSHPIPSSMPMHSSTPISASRVHYGQTNDPAFLMRLGKGHFLDLAISPSGDKLAIASSIGMQLFQLGTFSDLWSGFTDDAAEKVEFSPDGSCLLSLLKDGTVMLWDSESGDRLFALGGNQKIEDAAFSPNGRSLATVDSDGRAILWDVRNGEQLQTLIDEGTSLNAIAFSSDGSLMAIGAAEIIIIDTANQNRKLTLKNPDSKATISALAFSPDGSMLAVMDNRISLWDWSNEKQIQIFSNIPDHYAKSMAFSPNGSVFAIGTARGEIHLWDMRSKRWFHDPLTCWDVDQVRALAFSSNGADLYAANYTWTDKALIVWDVINGQEKRILEIPTIYEAKIASTSEGMLIGSIENNGPGGSKLSVYRLSASMDTIQHRQDVVHQFASDCFSSMHDFVIAPDGRSIAIALYGCGIDAAIYDITAGRFDKFIVGMNSRGMTYSPDSRLLSLDSDFAFVPENITHLVLRDWTDWDLAWRDLDPIVSIPYEDTTFLVYSPDATLLAGATPDGKIILWDLVSGEQLHTLLPQRGKIHDLAFSSDGALLASAGMDNKLILWDVADGKQLLSQSTLYKIEELAFSPDGTLLATLSNEGIFLWDTETLEPLFLLKGHYLPAEFLQFSIDGNTLLSSSCYDGAILWNIGALLAAEP